MHKDTRLLVGSSGLALGLSGVALVHTCPWLAVAFSTVAAVLLCWAVDDDDPPPPVAFI